MDEVMRPITTFRSATDEDRAVSSHAAQLASFVSLASDVRYLDDEIELVEEWIPRAGRALIGDGEGDSGLFHEASGGFWVDTDILRKSELNAAATEPPQGVRPTSTNRAFFALVEYLRFVDEHSQYDKDTRKRMVARITHCLSTIAGKYLLNNVQDFCTRYLEPKDDNDPSMFTASHWLLAVALADASSRSAQHDRSGIGRIISQGQADELRRATKEAASQMYDDLLYWRGGKLDTQHPDPDEKTEEDAVDDTVHDFISLYAARSWDAYCTGNRPQSPSEGHTGTPTEDKSSLTKPCRESRMKWDNLATSVRQRVLEQLAFHSAGISSKFDPIQLTFSIALLNRFTPSVSDVSLLTAEAVRIIHDAQAPDGSWPPARPLSREQGRLALVSSYEVALTLTHLLLGQLATGNWVQRDSQTYDLLLLSLRRTFEFIRLNLASVLVDGDRKSGGNVVKGWTNDHTRRVNFVESWATAIVLTFLVHYRDALLQLRQQLVLSQYADDVQHWEDRDPHLWAELRPAFRLPSSNAKNVWDDVTTTLGKISDPTEEGDLGESIGQEIVLAILGSWTQLTRKPNTGSLLLYGGPGTRKTSLVGVLARALGWPLLTLSPTQFLRRGGLEGFEASAADIFEDLLRLQRTVVLFDECEDFFKKRPSVGGAESGRDKSASNEAPKDQSADRIATSSDEATSAGIPSRDNSTSNDPERVESRTIGAFLTAGSLPRLQRLRDKGWTFFVLATNANPETSLDEAVTRPGRFDLQQEISYPVLEAQIRYVEKKWEQDHDPPRDERLGTLIRVLRNNPSYGSDVTFQNLDEMISTLDSRWDSNDKFIADAKNAEAKLEESLAMLTVRRGPQQLKDQYEQSGPQKMSLEEFLSRSSA